MDYPFPKRRILSGTVLLNCLLNCLLGLVAVGCTSVPVAENDRAFRFSPTTWNALWKPERAYWKAWGEEQLQTGDLVFTRGNYYMLLGAINFTDLATKMCDADFSHVGIVIIENHIPMVYDISDDGIQATPFDAYVTRHGYETVAIRRPLESTYQRLPLCVDYIREMQRKNVKFDKAFSLDNEPLYCTELIYEAFNSAGIKLCDAKRLDELPGHDRIQPTTLFLAKHYTGIDSTSPLICIGNESYGLYGSTWLSELLAATPVKSPPR